MIAIFISPIFLVIGIICEPPKTNEYLDWIDAMKERECKVSKTNQHGKILCFKCKQDDAEVCWEDTHQ